MIAAKATHIMGCVLGDCLGRAVTVVSEPSLPHSEHVTRAISPPSATPDESPMSADMRRQNRRNRRDTNHVTVGYGVFGIAFSALDSIKGQLA
jgi:hypothetical protein